MAEEHFGKKLAAMMGINVDLLNAEVRYAKSKEISQRLHIDLSEFNNGKKAEYIKNSLEYFEAKKIHFLNSKTVENDEPYYINLAAYEILNKLSDISDIDSAILDFEYYYDYDEEIKEFLLENKLIESKDFGDTFWDYVYDINKAEEIRGVLKDKNLNTTGNKRQLVDRCEENNLYEEFSEFNFKPSATGLEYMESYKWIDYYNIFLDCFDFDDFEKYMTESDSDSFFDIALEFLDKHEELAYKNKNFEALFDVYSSKALYYIVKKDMENALSEEINLFITRLNPVCGNDNLTFHHALDRVNVNNLNALIGICNGADLKKQFERNWNLMNFNHKRINKKSAYKYFIKALKTKDLDMI